MGYDLPLLLHLVHHPIHNEICITYGFENPGDELLIHEYILNDPKTTFTSTKNSTHNIQV